MTRLALACAGAAMLPSAILSNIRVFANGEPAITRKQRDLLAACQQTAQALGVLRGSINITQFSPGHGPVMMTWTMVLPAEDSITDSMDDLAKQILKAVPPQPYPWGGQGWGG